MCLSLCSFTVLHAYSGRSTHPTYDSTQIVSLITFIIKLFQLRDIYTAGEAVAVNLHSISSHTELKKKNNDCKSSNSHAMLTPAVQSTCVASYQPLNCVR